MTIQVNTDNHISATEGVAGHIEEIINNTLNRFDEHLTRVEVHLKDINGSKSDGTPDVHCTLEARMKGRDPIIVNNEAETVHQSVKGAADKMKALLGKTIEQMQNH